MLRDLIINSAAAEEGTKESPANSNRTKYGVWYGLDGVRWCAIFVSWIYNKAGVPLGKVDSSNGFHYCQSAYNHWKLNKELTKNPKKGDIVLFDWQGDGHCDHTGIFDSWRSGDKLSFYCWEGNTAVGNNSDGGMVMKRLRSATLVKAFVSPKVLGDSVSGNSVESLKKGDRGAEITLLQKNLYDLGYTLTVDGFFGTETEGVVKQFQKDHFLEENGIVNEMTKGAMEEELAKPKIPEKKIHTGSYLHKGNAGAAVLELQRALNISGASVSIDEDGVYGRQTKNAVKEFQRQRRLKIDGIVGPETLAALEVTV